MNVAHPAVPGLVPPARSLDRGAFGPVKLELRGITKTYGGVVALDGVDLRIRDGEFLTLLGPSGSGKSTLLMIVAGLIMPTRGSVFIDSDDATRTPPYAREMGVVFQHYALFPHMTVFENVAFPLRTRYVGGAEVGRRVGEALELVGLPAAGDRYPRQLSGGQQQRVALARALVWRPRLLLMDEPLGALDKGLRVQMQEEIRRIQQALAITALYVTHDQDEAMSMSDRIAIMRDGRLLQIGQADEIYEHPGSRFVASFVGESNLLAGRVAAHPTTVLVERVTDGREALPSAVGGPWAMSVDQGLAATSGQRVEFVLRPERIVLFDAGALPATENRVEGRVESAAYTGDTVRYRVRVPGGLLVIKQSNGPGIVRRRVGDPVLLGWHAEDLIPLTETPDYERSG